MRKCFTGTLSRNFPTREYDALKQQFEKTNNELSTSRRRCEHALSVSNCCNGNIITEGNC